MIHTQISFHSKNNNKNNIYIFFVLKNTTKHVIFKLHIWPSISIRQFSLQEKTQKKKEKKWGLDRKRGGIVKKMFDGK